MGHGMAGRLRATAALLRDCGLWAFALASAALAARSLGLVAW